jgi:hypothetical protein
MEEAFTMRRFILFLSTMAVLMGCATVVPPPTGSGSSLIIGELKVDVSGVGNSPNGASGWVYTDLPSAAALIVYNKSTRKTYEIRTVTPGDFFILANAEAGTYKLLELWAQVKTDNTYVTITSKFYKDFTFEVKPGRVTNLGDNKWDFTFNLTRSENSNGFVFNSDFPAAERALALVTSQWRGYEIDQASFSGETAAKPEAVPLQPRDNPNKILLIH